MSDPVSGPVGGPVQVLVIGFEDPTFTGDAVAELGRLREAGIVRLVDLLLVERDAEGAFHTVSDSVGGASGLGSVASALLHDEAGSGGTDNASATDSWSLDDAVAPGTLAVVALLEHVWARPLVAAVSRAGGRTLEETWLAPQDLQRLNELRDRASTSADCETGDGSDGAARPSGWVR